MLWIGMMPSAAFADGSSGHEALLKQAETLLVNYKESEALSLYEQVLKMEPDNYVALCKASILHVRIGDRFSDDTRKMEYFSKAKSYAEQAYELHPFDAEANFAMANSLAYIAKVAGPKQRLSLTNQIKSFADAAVVSNHGHAAAWHLLGRWHYKMANLNFAEEAAAKLFFGGVCGDASNIRAVESMKLAIQYNPANIQYYFDLATIYKDLKKKQDCISTLEQALTLELETKEELELSRRCKLMLQEQLK
ncbi:hypothetical protein [Pontibacter sp. SGAir0037]|uniref:tetratricopeptide repeat protein n=1 Tax=Pontibacter sp. SGAir0037 TaxID=2571030 RepID=UPI001F11680D|nr:hypothetical protein [Pontibacter sp. SGAir0037]